MYSRRSFLLTVVASVLLGLGPAGAEPKAYDLVTYQGKAEQMKLVFRYADGYPSASTLKVTEGSKTVTLSLASDELEFIPKDGGAIKRVRMELDPAATAPSKVKGTMLIGAKSVPFTLVKSK